MDEHTRPELLIALLVLAIHLVWAALISWSGSYIQSTPLSMITRTVGSPVILACVLMISCVSTVIGMNSRAALTRTLCFLPQQTLVSMTFVSSFEAVAAGQYADGVVRSFSFILSDQLPSMLIAVFHTVAVILLSKARG